MSTNKTILTNIIVQTANLISKQPSRLRLIATAFFDSGNRMAGVLCDYLWEVRHA